MASYVRGRPRRTGRRGGRRGGATRRGGYPPQYADYFAIPVGQWSAPDACMDDYVLVEFRDLLEHEAVAGDQPSYGGPPPDAYARVTNPERYIVVQNAADVLVKRLAQTYQVHLSEPDPDPDLVARLRASRAVRLDPDNSDAGPLVCTFTAFPGVILTLGGGYQCAYPSCGCDACNEVPDRVIGDLTQIVERYVQGGLSESVSGHTYSFRIGGLSGTMVIADDDARRALPAYRSWKAWPPA